MLENAYKDKEIKDILRTIKKEVQNSQYIDCKGFMDEIHEVIYTLYAKHEV